MAYTMIMDYKRYGPRQPASRRSPRGRKRWLKLLVIGALVVVVGVAGYKLFLGSSPQRAADRLQFDSSVTEAEQQTIRNAILDQEKTYSGTLTASVETDFSAGNASTVLAVYVPVTHIYSVRQEVSATELAEAEVFVPQGADDVVNSAIAKLVDKPADQLKPFADGEELDDTAVAFMRAKDLSAKVKLLALEGEYYLENLDSGAIFRQAVFNGGSADNLQDLQLNNLSRADDILKANMTGVTALTRGMMRKLQEVGGDGTYFSKHIGPFLRSADYTHTSNEVSFKDDCTYSTTLFCAPPAMIETLKDSGINLMELTGNHNNDVGRQYNTDTINQYHELGWHTFGGGLNAEEAAKPFIADQKDSKVAFLGYNYPDAPASGAIATADAAGANPWSGNQVQNDIASARQQADYVIVVVEYWECYAYPDGYVEYPECDLPIGEQTQVFRQIADWGADMVVGTSAHQPQTYEMYDGTPIYYGLGNLYFDQTRWPGTERSIVLTHYFASGELLQTKLTATVYDSSLQTRLMDKDETNYLLNRLKTARATAGL